MKSIGKEQYTRVGGWYILLDCIKEDPPRALGEVVACVAVFGALFVLLYFNEILRLAAGWLG
jgi:hypothetical protein